MGGLFSSGAVNSIRNCVSVGRVSILRFKGIISGNFQTSNDSGCFRPFYINYLRYLGNEEQSAIDFGASRHSICIGG